MTAHLPPRRLRTAFTEIYTSGWTAGALYYQNLFLALRSLEDAQRPEIIVLRAFWEGLGEKAGYRAYVDELLELPPDAGAGPPPTFAQRQGRRVRRWLGLPPTAPKPAPPPLEQFLRQREVDLVFTCWAEFGPNFKLPLLGWIPDFQHVHWPELFQPEELTRRDQLFTAMAQHCSRIILSSADAEQDFRRFGPAHAHKARILRFVAQLPAEVYADDPGRICGHYHIPERFVYLPDQFWRHKNHAVVLAALSLLKTSHPEATVVCTGNTNDHRAPLHFAELLTQIARLGLRNNFILLGWVPHADIFQLMRQALAVLQPSLFEGWSTTVEEAKSLGKTIVLSDIAIHREQNPPAALFFDPADPAALAEALRQVYAACRPGPDAALEADARAQLPARTRAYAETFLTIARDAVAAA